MLDASHPYYKQLVLLMDLLRISTSESCFALKGGTAINLFYRDLPRLSVGIDLTYLPIEPRSESLRNIQKALDRTAGEMEKRVKGLRIIRRGRIEGAFTKLLVHRGMANVKIEALRRIGSATSAGFV